MHHEFRKESVIAAAFQFRQELRELSIAEQEKTKYLEQFIQAFKRSGDYDTASASVMDSVMAGVSRKSLFKDTWTGINKMQVEKELSKMDNIDEIEERAKEIFIQEKKQGVNWKEQVVQVAKVLVAIFGITFAGAVYIASKIGSSKE
jgi:hypothetical protein